MPPSLCTGPLTAPSCITAWATSCSLPKLKRMRFNFVPGATQRSAAACRNRRACGFSQKADKPSGVTADHWCTHRHHEGDEGHRQRSHRREGQPYGGCWWAGASTGARWSHGAGCQRRDHRAGLYRCALAWRHGRRRHHSPAKLGQLRFAGLWRDDLAPTRPDHCGNLSRRRKCSEQARWPWATRIFSLRAPFCMAPKATSSRRLWKARPTCTYPFETLAGRREQISVKSSRPAPARAAPASLSKPHAEPP